MPATLAGHVSPHQDTKPPGQQNDDPPPPMADQGEDVREIVYPRVPWAEARDYRELRRAPNIGRRPLVLGILHNAPCLALVPLAAPPPQHMDIPLYNDCYSAALGDPDFPLDYVHPFQHRLGKLDVFKAENGEIHLVEEFAAFHAWDPVETCRQGRTHLRGVALANNCRTPLPPRN